MNPDKPHATNQVKKIGRTTYFINHHFISNRNLEKVLLRLILGDKSLL